MKRWDVLLVLGLLLVAAGVAAVDWRAGAVVAGLSLVAAWYWLDETGEG